MSQRKWQNLVLAELRKLNTKFDTLSSDLKRVASKKSEQVEIASHNMLLNFPDHLRKTIVALSVNMGGTATADEIAEITTRARAVESGYLNQLTLQGLVKKRRIGRRAYFTLVE